MPSEYNHIDPEQFRKGVHLIHKIIDILDEFKYNYRKKFNFSKLAELLKIPKTEVDDLIALLLNVQDKFETTFKNYHLIKKREYGQLYLVAEHKIVIPEFKVPQNIILSQFQVKLYNDIFYMFRYVNRGKGFDLSSNGTELSKNVKNLITHHPYLFETKENGLIYPSALGMNLGDLIISYNKGNKPIERFELDNHIIIVSNDG
ncbi:MAG: hypothetical protein ACFFB8_18390 [Promethearchaeota archaeon]